MVNGNRGDHPLTDILFHKMEVYGEETDDLIRMIGSLSSSRELYEWWEEAIGWSCDEVTLLEKCRLRYAELLDRARKGGWEVDDEHRTG